MIHNPYLIFGISFEKNKIDNIELPDNKKQILLLDAVNLYGKAMTSVAY